MRIVISTLVHGRHETAIKANLQNVLAGVNDFTCCYTDSKDQELSMIISSEHLVIAPNTISGKAQASLELCKQVDHDAVMLMGCDDYIDKKALLLVKELLKDHDYIGFLDIYFRDGGEYLYWPGYTSGNRIGEPAGAGKTVRKDLLERMDYKVFKDTGNGNTDLDSHKALIEYAKTPIMISCKAEGVMLVDIKDGESTTPLERFSNLERLNNVPE